MLQQDMNSEDLYEITTNLIETVLACLEGRTTFKSLFILEEKLYGKPFIEDDKSLEKAVVLIHELKMDMTKGKISQEVMKNYFNDIMVELTRKLG